MKVKEVKVFSYKNSHFHLIKSSNTLDNSKIEH